ncbi:LON peptidase N-terminal domain and RING finger protein C14F5.10c-like [Coregonus clupeaformis]|uniref:LON peptidase N-terminal domain and RING finger protein C14F5.10c-like n=1 Tax=Coregonus clupeaformis TaxID=59861 RepID=UPI001E1C8C78|nr:LON peptidase N-terminal domain and RING finger protein C14F5.10c-like [Coregonus clupeaformis]
MGLTSEDMECCICLQPYSRMEKIPRMLHCKHTFCGPCLQTMSSLQSGLLTVRCPLCRWITCTGPILTLSGSLWVNTEIWDQILDRQQEEEEEEEEEEEKEWMGANRQTQTTTQYECSPSGHSGLRLKLQKFLRRMKHKVL